jgi:hypothetical protein
MRLSRDDEVKRRWSAPGSLVNRSQQPLRSCGLMGDEEDVGGLLGHDFPPAEDA